MFFLRRFWPLLPTGRLRRTALSSLDANQPGPVPPSTQPRAASIPTYPLSAIHVLAGQGFNPDIRLPCDLRL